MVVVLLGSMVLVKRESGGERRMENAWRVDRERETMCLLEDGGKH